MRVQPLARIGRWGIPAILAMAAAGAVPPGTGGEALARGSTDGYLYGKVTTRDGDEYVGLLRWGTEEAFWDDHFNSAKTDLHYADYLPRREKRERRTSIRLFGYRIGVDSDDIAATHVFACRFADIAKIEPEGDDDARVTMRSGSEFHVSDYANDVGTDVSVQDASLGEIALKWDRIEVVEFEPTPAGVAPTAYRLRGKVETDIGDFEGPIQWDSDECLSTDKLDGESRDGKMSIEFGKIRSIERTHDQCRVELKDGREVTLGGTNDVDETIRGILVEDPRYGRVEVEWDSFDRAVFEDAGDSGRGYNDFPAGRPLRGTVTDLEGKTHSGRIVFDLDEAETWEMLNGKLSDVEYNIPFEMIASIEPGGRRSSNVVLRNGEKLRLTDGQDVSEDNDGVLIFASEAEEGAEPVYLEWSEVDRIDFD